MPTTTGDTFSPAITIGGGTYAKHFDNFVAFGPEKPWEKAPADLHVGSIHSADEGVSEDALEEAIAIYADAIEKAGFLMRMRRIPWAADYLTTSALACSCA